MGILDKVAMEEIHPVA